MDTPQKAAVSAYEVSGTYARNDPVFSFVRKDHKQDGEGGWSMVVVLGYSGELEQSEERKGGDCISEDQIQDIYAAVEKLSGWHLASEGCGGAGQAFAREPMLDIYPSTIIVSQYGGRDI